MICKECGAYNPDHATFCKVCAASLKPDAAPKASEEEQQPTKRFSRPLRIAPEQSEQRLPDNRKTVKTAETAIKTVGTASAAVETEMKNNIMANDCFISYARKDYAVADYVVDLLEKVKINCWIDRNNAIAGFDYAASIVKAIRDSRVIILIISQTSGESQNVIRELNTAADLNKTIIPIKIDDSDLSDAMVYYLGKTQWIDAINQKTDWNQKTIEALHLAVKSALIISGRNGFGDDASDNNAVPSDRPQQTPVKQNNTVNTIVCGKLDSKKLTAKMVASLVQKYQLDGIYYIAGTSAFEKTIHKAIKAYAYSAQEEKPLLMYDETEFGSAKRGFVLTRTKLHYSIWLYGKHCFQIEDIKSVDMQFADKSDSLYFITMTMCANNPKHSETSVAIAHRADKNKAGRIAAFWKELFESIKA